MTNKETVMLSHLVRKIKKHRKTVERLFESNVAQWTKAECKIRKDRRRYRINEERTYKLVPATNACKNDSRLQTLKKHHPIFTDTPF